MVSKYNVPTSVRTYLMNMDNGDRIFLQFEPKVITGAVEANYNSDPAIGGTHENLMFSHTNNETFSLEIRWNRIMLTAITGKSTDRADTIIDNHRAFIRSLLNPIRIVPGVVGGEPPLVNVVVPGILNVIARLINIDWEVTSRDPTNGKIMDMVMRCSFKEDPRYRYSSSDMFDAGYERG